VGRSRNASVPRNRAAAWWRAKLCPVPDCWKPNTVMQRHFQQCHSDLSASKVKKYMTSLRIEKIMSSVRRQQVGQLPQDNTVPTTVNDPQPSISATTINVCLTVYLLAQLFYISVFLYISVCVKMCLCDIAISFMSFTAVFSMCTVMYHFKAVIHFSAHTCIVLSFLSSVYVFFPSANVFHHCLPVCLSVCAYVCVCLKTCMCDIAISGIFTAICTVYILAQVQVHFLLHLSRCQGQN